MFPARLVHAPSGRVYNLQFESQKPKIAGKDDVTGEPLTRRPDDEPVNTHTVLCVANGIKSIGGE